MLFSNGIHDKDWLHFVKLNNWPIQVSTEGLVFVASFAESVLSQGTLNQPVSEHGAKAHTTEQDRRFHGHLISFCRLLAV